MRAGVTHYRDYDRAGLDAQYYMRGLIPEWADFFKKWGESSRDARHRRAAHLDLAYGAGADERVDVFPANGESPAPLQVFIHGGYWQAMSKDDFSYVADGIVDAGAALAVIDYTLAPAADIDEIVRQNRAAVAWLWRHAGEFGADADRLFVSGHSAGGHLVGMMLATDWPAIEPDLPPDLIAGACAISSLFDLEPMRLCYVNDKLGLDEAQARHNSPIHVSPKHAAPLIVAVGGDETDEFRRQSEAYAARLRSLGHPVQTMTPAGDNHYTIVDGLGRADHELTRAMLRQMSLE